MVRKNSNELFWPTHYLKVSVSSLAIPCVCVTQLCSTFCNPMVCRPPGSSVHADSPGKNTGVGCHALLQGIISCLFSHTLANIDIINFKILFSPIGEKGSFWVQFVLLINKVGHLSTWETRVFVHIYIYGEGDIIYISIYLYHYGAYSSLIKIHFELLSELAEVVIQIK